MKATIENIKDVIIKADLLGNVSKMKSNVSLNEQGIDSLDSWTIYLLIEEEFHVKIPDEDLDKVQTIDDIVKYLNR